MVVMSRMVPADLLLRTPGEDGLGLGYTTARLVQKQTQFQTTTQFSLVYVTLFLLATSSLQRLALNTSRKDSAQQLLKY